MRKYRLNAATSIRLDYGLELLQGLALFPETAGLVASLQVVNDELEAAFEARRQKRKPLLSARVALRFENYRADQTIRMLDAVAKIADGARRGPVHAALFPEGLTPVVAPAGSRQLAPTKELLDRLKKSHVPGVMALVPEQAPKLEAAVAQLGAAVTAHAAAREAYLDAFKDEVALRQEHALTVDKLMGLVRAAFPNDRVKQDLVFPEVESARAGASEAEDDGDAEAPEAAPAAEPVA